MSGMSMFWREKNLNDTSLRFAMHVAKSIYLHLGVTKDALHERKKMPTS